MTEYLCDECETDLSDENEISVSQEVECWDLPNYFRDLCLECATDEAMDDLGTDDREKARKAVLGAISG